MQMQIGVPSFPGPAVRPSAATVRRTRSRDWPAAPLPLCIPAAHDWIGHVQDIQPRPVSPWSIRVNSCIVPVR
jgi:hypothetical protein